MRLQSRPRSDLLRMLHASLAAVDGRTAVRNRLERQPRSSEYAVVAIGKAAQAMALGAADAVPGGIRRALLVTKAGHLDAASLQGRDWQTVVGGHPVPDAGSLAAGRALLQFIDETEEPLLFLISGGASALVAAPVDGVDLVALQHVNRWLLGSGLDIAAMNAVRVALSRIKGGGLLRWLRRGRWVRVLAISDVPHNDPGVIGSGLLVPLPDLRERIGELDLPDWIAGAVASGMAQRGRLPTTGPEVEIVADNEQAKRAAAHEAEALGYAVALHSGFVEGPAEGAGRRLARALVEGPGGVHVWGGETVVALPSAPGRGGRNQHLALAAARELAGRRGGWLLSVGTDGTDGPTEDAGALVDGGTLARAEALGLNVDTALRRADAGSVLAATGDLIHTGPTDTNVMDLMIGVRFDDAPV